MKKYLIATLMLLTLATTTQAAAQKHRHHPKVTAPTVTPTTTAADTAGVEVFSDTTATAEQDSLPAYHTHTNVQVHAPIDLDRLMDNIDFEDIAGMFMIVCIVAIVFLLSPLLIMAMIFYFINKNRKDKMKLAEMAMRNGQPMPEPVARPRSALYEMNLRRGVKQIFLGIGLMILLGITFLGKLGFGIGALVFFLGLGKLVIALLDKHQSETDSYVPPVRPTPPPVDQPTAQADNTQTPDIK
ncbi:MAG: hypothetical protein IJ527_06550 [Prevotella sp.]|nr:hypothetical protein [Prevotella sp.]